MNSRLNRKLLSWFYCCCPCRVKSFRIIKGEKLLKKKIKPQKTWDGRKT